MKLYDAMLKQDSRTVTKKPRVTKSLVTEIREMAKLGRPRKPNKLTASQKQKAYRDRKRTAHD